MAKDFKDGFYHSSDLVDCMDDTFKSESDLRQFVIDNITHFTQDIGFEYASHTKEYALMPWQKRSKGSRRVDLLIKTECGTNILIECKRPKFMCELLAGVGQMMSYISVFERQGAKGIYILLATKLDPMIPEVITKFNLPIKYVVLDKTKLLVWPGQRLN